MDFITQQFPWLGRVVGGLGLVQTMFLTSSMGAWFPIVLKNRTTRGIFFLASQKARSTNQWLTFVVLHSCRMLAIA